LQQPDQSESCDHPAVATVLAFAGTEISAAEQRNTGEHEEHDRKRDQGRMREEGGKAAEAKDGKAEVGKGPHDGEGR
jgi:hypothetical protein